MVLVPGYKQCPLLVRTHCINHRLALACGDANDQVNFITIVETTLRQLWKWLEYPKRCSAYIKVCESLRRIQVPADYTQKKSLAVKSPEGLQDTMAVNRAKCIKCMYKFGGTDANAQKIQGA